MDGSSKNFIIVNINFFQFAILIAACPLITLFICIFISIYFHSETSTLTHCKVKNILPSLSAAFGDENPEKFIWQIGVAFHLGPRLYVGYLYKGLYNSLLQEKYYTPSKIISKHYYYTNICRLATYLYFQEIISLSILTYISSSDDFMIHAASFTVFIISSIIYMKMSCIIFSHYTSLFSLNKNHALSLKLKRKISNSIIVIIILAAYLYRRHNTFCEPYVYSLFALSEYTFVILNIIFHGLAILDFDSYCVSFLPSHEISVLHRV
ncbi:post-GPI attachment to proteins factor 2-like isoform X1 [Gordionus sp. m RMFG-2023]|uniref:post-GPI attachment to proteins factor 2-like isoform X1 n=1 Tax=Gordionus sp. m RMFG-2023 TaxID=3053472 RepID=UPI0031FC8BCB